MKISWLKRDIFRKQEKTSNQFKTCLGQFWRNQREKWKTCYLISLEHSEQNALIRKIQTCLQMGEPDFATWQLVECCKTHCRNETKKKVGKY